MLYIISSSQGSETVKNFKDAIEGILKIRTLVTRNVGNILRSNRPPVLNWGHRYDLPGMGVINNPKLVQFCSERLYQMFFPNQNRLINVVWGIPDISEYPIVVRDDIRLSNSRTVRIVRPEDDEHFDDPVFYSRYVDFAAEYRLLLASHRGQIIFNKVYKKTFSGRGILPEDHGYRLLSRPRIIGLKDMVSDIHETIMSVGFENYIVGADLGRRSPDNALFLIEINSTPFVNYNTAYQIVEALNLSGYFRDTIKEFYND